MINSKLLESRIKDSGIKKKVLADKMGINQKTLYSKIVGATEFKVSEIEVICRLLALSNNDRDKIFFSTKSWIASNI